jgi:hypothetical protein
MRDSSQKLRALRRHQEKRLKQRVKGYYGGFARGDARRVGKVAHARQPCSCPDCGNPRRHFGGPTIQERRHRDADVEYKEVAEV